MLHFVIHIFLLYRDTFERRGFRDLLWHIYVYIYTVLLLLQLTNKQQDIFKMLVYYYISD